MSDDRFLSVALRAHENALHGCINLQQELMPEASEVRGLLLAIGDLYDRASALAEAREKLQRPVLEGAK